VNILNSRRKFSECRFKHYLKIKRMKKLLSILISGLVLLSTAVDAKYQRGYTKKNGTYVSGHLKSNPDSKRYNNYGSKSNGGHQRDEFSSPPAYNKRAR
jgi:hypothetical protein